MIESDDQHPVTAGAAKAGYRHTKLGYWTSFYADDRPTIHIGQLAELDRIAARDPGFWPFGGLAADTVGAMQRWHELTGIAWHAGPAIMGIELLHRKLPSYRLAGGKGLHRPLKKDAGGPDDARESVWTPDQW